jgi:hypothetical protein
VISVIDLKEGIFHEEVDSPAAAYPAVVRRNVDVVACRRRISATDVLARQLWWALTFRRCRQEPSE